MMLPPPSRSPLRHPLAAADLAAFCHPHRPEFRHPVRHGDHLMAANGIIALRLSRGPALHDDTVAPAPAGFAEKIDTLPWARLDSPGSTIVPPDWRPLDAVRGMIYQNPPERLFHGRTMTTATPVWTADAMLVPLAVLQLLARLPAVAIRTPADPDFLLFRFSGGDGLIANRWRHAAPSDIPASAFRLLGHRHHNPLPGGLA